MQFLVTVITINYNNAAGLERTIKSVREQTAQDVEHIVIDGGSTDGSKEIIEKYKSGFSYWVSEPDHGVYDAMNKGIARATGTYLLFLNSGDTLHGNDILSNIQPFLTGNEAIIYGNLNMIKENGSSFINTYPQKLDFNFFKNTSLGHPATFIKSTLFKKYGNYRTDLNIVADWAFFLKTICIEQVSYKKVTLVIANFYEGGISTALAHETKHKEELKKVILEHYDLYDAHFNALLDVAQKRAVLHPQVDFVVTNPILLNMLNRVIAVFAFILKKKRS